MCERNRGEGMKIKLDTEMPFEIKFSVSKGEPRTRWDPGCPAECEIESITIRFKVEQSWVKENDIDKETILLTRYYNGEWQELPITYISEDTTYIYFDAEAPGLSTFAIVGNELEVAPEIGIPWLIIIFIMIAAIVGVGLFLYKKNKK